MPSWSSLQLRAAYRARCIGGPSAGLLYAIHIYEYVQPFFQHMMHNDEDMFVFKNTRSVSGNTLDAFPSLMTGCLPFNDSGHELLNEMGRSIGYNFLNAGYSTASFSSYYDNVIESGKYKVMYDELVGGMDYVVDPMRKRWPLPNGDGSDDNDRILLPVFEEWLRDEVGNSNVGRNSTESESTKAPFYAQLYAFNQVRKYE